MMNEKYDLNKAKQNGSAIIVCLTLLTVATLLAINSVSSTVLEEKIAGNIRSKQISFQSAEAGLRAGETFAATLGLNPVIDGTSGLYPISNPGDTKGLLGALANYPVWEDSANTAWVNATTAGLTNPIPQYIIEDYSTAPLFLGCSNDYENAPACTKEVYRITARSVGLNNSAMSIIQSTYKKL